MSIQATDFGEELRHSELQDALQSLNQLNIVVGLVIAQEALKCCYKAVSGHFLLTSELLREFLALQDFLYLWSSKNTHFDLFSQTA